MTQLKNSLTAFLFGLSFLCSSGQVAPSLSIVRTPYDSLQDKKLELIQLRLEKSHNEFSTGVGIFVAGIIVSTFGLAIKSDELSTVGIGLGTVGSIFMISSHRHIGKAGRVRRSKPLTEY